MIIGPFTQEDWLTLRQTKVTIKELKSISNPLVERELDRELRLYRYILNLYREGKDEGSVASNSAAA